jgi:hypothetical protein
LRDNTVQLRVNKPLSVVSGQYYAAHMRPVGADS